MTVSGPVRAVERAAEVIASTASVWLWIGTSRANHAPSASNCRAVAEALAAERLLVDAETERLVRLGKAVEATGRIVEDEGIGKDNLSAIGWNDCRPEVAPMLDLPSVLLSPVEAERVREALGRECETCEWQPGLVDNPLGVDQPMVPCPDCVGGVRPARSVELLVKGEPCSSASWCLAAVNRQCVYGGPDPECECDERQSIWRPPSGWSDGQRVELRVECPTCGGSGHGEYDPGASKMNPGMTVYHPCPDCEVSAPSPSKLTVPLAVATVKVLPVDGVQWRVVLDELEGL